MYICKKRLNIRLAKVLNLSTYAHYLCVFSVKITQKPFYPICSPTSKLDTKVW